MPLLDYFRLPRLARAPALPPAAEPTTGAAGRLHRVVRRQRAIRIPTDIERRLEAMESECSEPLYDSSAYGSPSADPAER